ncbi:hypothetical protein CDV31_001523 [Fusarium ambrosium]|uniref:Major facilitator superfamily (MFS) profile domain-containing protein n=1 Tax=Fusarium ambrosium TaxID=131363 RepID=A0A428UZH7_9HYPO|nr:hypothetical protein CDV31_001523 [Fusarium ambrosium]
MTHGQVVVESEDPESATNTIIDVEKLGRQRPAAFATIWAELGFIFALLGSMAMAEFFVSGFHIILPPLAIELEIPEASRTWPSSVFSLVTGAFLLPLGRLSDMHGAYIIFIAGLAWMSIWCLVAGFSHNYIMLIICRALQGIGAAAFLPAGITLLGKTYRPGPRKNFVFAIYGAFAPLGFFIGILIGGISGEYLSWKWYFWIGAIILVVIFAAGFFSIPNDFTRQPPDGLGMDWWGVATIVPGLILLVYAITDSSQAPKGWASPQIIATMIIGVLILAAAVYLEGWVVTNPLVPADLFSPPYMTTLVVALFFAYGSFGVFLLYSSFYIELVLEVSPLLTALWYVPMIVGGLLLATVGGLVLHRLPGRILLIVSGVGYVVCCLLFALMPENPNYWAWVLPAMVASTVGIDITFTVSNVFITTNLPARRQGLAGALINSTLFLGISFFLGFADVAVGQTSRPTLRESYQVGLWFGVGISGVALLMLSFINVGRAKSDLTVEEREQMEAARTRGE